MDDLKRFTDEELQRWIVALREGAALCKREAEEKTRTAINMQDELINRLFSRIRNS
jgi:hypothetical protein